MLENTQRGWHGAFSSVGRNSAEKYHIIMNKDHILNTKTKMQNNQLVVNFLKRNGYSNIPNEKDEFNDSNYSLDNQLDAIEDNIDIFQINNTEKSDDKKKKKYHGHDRPKTVTHRTNSEAYKYHDKHMKEGVKIKPDKTPVCTKYNPRHDLVWPRTIVGPAWNTITPRPSLGRQDDSKYYLSHEDPLKNIGHSFINMKKQSMRGDFVANSNNVRLARTKPFKYDKKAMKRTRPLTSKTSNISAISKFSKRESKQRVSTAGTSSFARVASASSSNLKKNRPFSSNRPISVTTNCSSRPITTAGRGNHITTDELFTGRHSSHISSQSCSDEGESIVNMNDTESSLEDSYDNYKAFYQKQIKKRPKTAFDIRSTTTGKFSTASPPKAEKGKRSQKVNTTNSRGMSPSASHSMIEKTKTRQRIKTPDFKKMYPPGFRSKIEKVKRHQNIRAPDFKKIISREYYDNLHDKKTLIPFSLPNFKQVRERPIMMVVYDKKVHKKRKPPEIKGIEPSLFYDQNKALDKINNYQTVHSPNFDMMSSRPDDNNPLPSYMKKVFNRGSAYYITDQTLKMNNYSEGKFRTTYTSFWPKKSFNKIINLNLLNSDTFINGAFGDKKGIEKRNDYIAKSMKFYNKNYDDLLKESLLNRFDNVTYKTIKSENKLEERDVEKFLQNFQQKKNEE